MSAGLKGNVELKQIKLGAGRLFKGITGTSTFTGAAKFNTESPGSTWRDLGNLQNDTALNMSTEMFTLKNGIPSLAKKRFIIGRDGTLECNFNEFGAFINKLALGLSAPINKLESTEYTVAASPSPTAQVFTLDSVTGLAVGDEIVTEALTGSLAASDNRGLIASIATLAVTLREPLPTAPASTWKVKEVRCTKLYFGGGALDTYPLLFVVDLLEGKQIVYHFPRVSVKGDYAPDTGRGTENMKLKVTFDTYSENDSDADAAILCAMYMFESEG